MRAQMKMHLYTMLLQPVRCCGCQALADLQRKLTQPVVQSADVAQADADVAEFPEFHVRAV
jgi:hypothetical protein